MSDNVSIAKSIKANSSSHACYQGQTHGHKGFLLGINDAHALKASDIELRSYIHPYMITDDLIGTKDSLPSRYVIDFENLDVLTVQKFKAVFKGIETTILKDRLKAAAKEKEQNEEALAEDENAKLAKDHENALKTWWLFFRRRGELLLEIGNLHRYIVCGRTRKDPSSSLSPLKSIRTIHLPSFLSVMIIPSESFNRGFIGFGSQTAVRR